ncbi:quinone-dependent dihydroorotate dehydrogenase [Taklimakanibacter albus]|uniref:Quinone-dependent dihydroorotate dehydrogenase n=1 Tax=Taklimakanibacter albus TaxID=2800327 RepID=A0ACC5RDY1_9HYPH|nr:quinone-dependent dihydroorotate dehydrogenase [Aestuariivirga sp. YIM B02566]MBK1870875.1 quinone-dependent dihydroorotate dehydrogenase [Aestuariivirga sp. YIM B02566]
MSLSRRSFPLIRPLLHAFDAETAHRLTITALKLAPAAQAQAFAPELAASLFGLSFAHPLGLAAGFDKNGEVPDAMLAEGLSFVEVGTVTPLPQQGNPRPRLFRLSEDQAVINRMGFNNEGHDALRRRLEARRARGGIVGVNIGANKDAADRIGDYVKGLEAFRDLASYLTVNISSPNTPGLRNLQSKAELETLLGRLNEARARKATPPLLVKIAPDLAEADLDDIAQVFLTEKVDGVIVSNTTITRPHLRSTHARETGGLSGRPLFDLATYMLAQLYLRLEGRIPLIGVGGIDSAEAAFAKIAAGAHLLQLYSALVFEGPVLVTRIVDGLTAKCRASGFSNIGQAVGRTARDYQKRPGI